MMCLVFALLACLGFISSAALYFTKHYDRLQLPSGEAAEIQAKEEENPWSTSMVLEYGDENDESAFDDIDAILNSDLTDVGNEIVLEDEDDDDPL